MNTWSTAMPDWDRRIMAGQSLVPELPLFQAEAEKALRIFKRLRIPDVIGKPTMAEACGPWFFPIVAAMFGSYNPETHRRMLQEFFLLIPKKNAKSSNGGPVMLTAVIMNRRPEAEFIFIAPTIEVANIAFNQASGTIRCDPELDKLFQIQTHQRTITHRKTGATLKIKAADTDVITGGKQVGTMIDETHVFAKKSNAADIFVEIRGALAARPDGFLFQTTTQSKDTPAGVFKSELAIARDVRDGDIELPLLPVLYEFPEPLLESGRWKERKFWPVVNPNLGRSVDEAFLERELMKAEREGPNTEAMLLLASQHFNIEIGLRLRNDAWAGARYWQTSTDETLTFETLLERSEVVVVGIDGGGLDDMLGLAVLGRCKETRTWLLWVRAWVHEDVLKLRKDIAERLRDFAVDDDLVIRSGLTSDLKDVSGIIERIRDEGLFPEKHAVGFDPQGVAAMVDELAELGIVEPQCIAVPQGYKLSNASWGMERKLENGTLKHAGQGMMSWCVGNAKAVQKGSAVVIEKQTSGKAKIDPLVAAFNAFVLMSRNPIAAGALVSPWEDPNYRMVA